MIVVIIIQTNKEDVGAFKLLSRSSDKSRWAVEVKDDFKYPLDRSERVQKTRYPLNKSEQVQKTTSHRIHPDESSSWECGGLGVEALHTPTTHRIHPDESPSRDLGVWT